MAGHGLCPAIGERRLGQAHVAQCGAETRLGDIAPARQHGAFEATRIPFLTDTDQMSAASYATQTSPRVFVVTPSGYWLWRTGKTVFDAIAAAYADCQKGASGQVCVLYAVNDRVVFEPGHD